MAALTAELGALFAEVDLVGLSPEEFNTEIFDFMSQLRDQLRPGGEVAYHCRQAALYEVSALQRALRRDLDPRDVPQEHAQLLDAMFSKIDSVRTGVAGTEAKLDRLEKLENDSKKFFKEATQGQRRTLKVPLG